MFTFIIYFLSMNLLADPLCQVPEKPKDFRISQEQFQKQLRIFSEKKLIASKADKTLSQLIQAKSPMITKWITSHNLDSQSEEDIVRAWRLYFAEFFILSKYPQNHQKIDHEIEKFVDEQLRKAFPSVYKKQMEKLFQEAKKYSLQKMNKMNPAEKQTILERIEKIKLYWPKSLKTAKNQSQPLDIIQWGIAYDPLANEINLGIHALAYPNKTTILAVFAHEIGHSFDSCRWNAYFKGAWPFQKIEECLRSSESVSAKKRDDSLIEKYSQEGKIPSDLMMALKQNPTCNKSSYPPIGTQADQLPESFADWFSAEVLSEIPDIVKSDLRTDLCESNSLIPGSSYPSNQDRLQRIYRVHPAFVETATKNEKLFRYCAYP